MDPPPKKRRLSPGATSPPPPPTESEPEESTDFKLAILASLHPDREQSVLLDYLLAYNGSVEEVGKALSAPEPEPSRKRSTIGYQSSLASYTTSDRAEKGGVTSSAKPLAKKGKTVNLYSPEDIETHTPCTIIHNFLPAEDANALLQELLTESPTFRREHFQLFDRAVSSPHTFRFYVDSASEAEAQKTDYIYSGRAMHDVGTTPPIMRRISHRVSTAVNAAITHRNTTRGSKLPLQSPAPWHPNASFVNCYTGASESVGYHSDQLTYLGPHPTIGSLSLGVARFFRVRRVLPPSTTTTPTPTHDATGQLAIHLPHNSLLIMHASMQEEWKHAIAPTPTIDPHPLAGIRRLNITYRYYRPDFHPKLTPRCACGVPAVLRCVQKREVSRGRYLWQCHAGAAVGGKDCGWMEWGRFDADGRPPWAEGFGGDCNFAGLRGGDGGDEEGEKKSAGEESAGEKSAEVEESVVGVGATLSDDGVGAGRRDGEAAGSGET